VLKHTSISGNITYELFFVLLPSLMAYVLCEAIGMSGIFAIFFCAICQNHYTFHNLSPGAQAMLPQIFHSLAHLCETIGK
jgi:NhaP-type Na+/H+ or K+/H+ antiporter